MISWPLPPHRDTGRAHVYEPGGSPPQTLNLLVVLDLQPPVP